MCRLGFFKINNKIDLICPDLTKADIYIFLLLLEYFVILVGHLQKKKKKSCKVLHSLLTIIY